MTVPPIASLFGWVFEENNGRYLLEGFLINIEIALVSILVAMVFGLALALLRLVRNRYVAFAAGLWVDTFRNLPLILLILFLTSLLKPVRQAWQDAAPNFLPEAFQSGLVVGALAGLILYNSAVLAEIFRAGILSLPRGQREAAAALGLDYSQSMRLVVLPQGLRRMVPAAVSQLITLNKDTTLVSLIAFQDVMRRGRSVIANAGNPFTGSEVEAPILEVFLFIGILFIIVNLALSRLSRRLEIRERKRLGTKLERVKGLEDQVAAEPT
jgi:His/Glu/Gln/Arg/opine family amino acid ABC transporter permease subunit